MSDSEFINRILYTKEIRAVPVFLNESNEISQFIDLPHTNFSQFSEERLFSSLEYILGRVYTFAELERYQRKLEVAIDFRKNGCVGCLYIHTATNEFVGFIPSTKLPEHIKTLGEYRITDQHSDSILFLNAGPLLSIVSEDKYFKISQISSVKTDLFDKYGRQIYTKAFTESDSSVQILSPEECMSHYI